MPQHSCVLMLVHAFTRLLRIPHWTTPWAKATSRVIWDLVVSSNGHLLPISALEICSRQGLSYTREQGLVGGAFSKLLALYK